MLCGSWHSVTADSVGAPPGESKGCLSRAASLYLLGSVATSYLASASAPTPLYPVYQSKWGFSPVAITFVFGIYAIAVLGALLVTGRLSDYTGRRPVLIVATALAGCLYIPAFFVQAVWQLIVVRALVGLCLGAAMPCARYCSPSSRSAWVSMCGAAATSFSASAIASVNGSVYMR